MSNTFWQTLASTPWWVYALFIYFMQISWIATKPRIIPIRSLLILPSIFITLSIISLAYLLQMDASTLFLWSSAMTIGIPLGWMQFYLQKIKAIKNEAKLYIPGTWSLFFIFALLFFVKYYYRYEFAIDPLTIATSPYAPYIVLFYGVCTGLFIGKLIYSINCYQSGPYFSER